MGVSHLFCDEAHEFKHPAFVTKMRNIAGLGNVAGSDKAFDLYVKARYIQKQNDGKGVFFATGTPISNSVAELYTMQRYLQYGLLKEKGLPASTPGLRPLTRLLPAGNLAPLGWAIRSKPASLGLRTSPD